MDIKFKKLFKTIVIFFVVFVMIFNSFAAISVSDGSAFVTKAEFSADLNNLSNRMSALENSIDAKIDSLVSSYLSRNGIWNGEKQTTNSTTSWTLAPKTPSISSNTFSWSGNLLNQTIISELTKSGLLVGFVYFVDGGTGNSNASRWGYQGVLSGSGNWYSDSGLFLSTSLYETTKENPTTSLKSSTVIGSATAVGKNPQVSNNNFMLAFSLPSEEILVPISFFVQKESKISMRVFQDIHLISTQSAESSYTHLIRVGFKDQFYVY